MLPQLLQGPPGTGKTDSLVELVRLILTTSDAKVLFCTSCNKSADRFAHLLMKQRAIQCQWLFRLCALGYDHTNMAFNLDRITLKP